MSYRPGKRKEHRDAPFDGDFPYRQGKVHVSTEHIASRMLDLRLGSPDSRSSSEEVPIVFNPMPPPPCRSVAMASTQSVQMSHGCPGQPVAPRCGKPSGRCGSWRKMAANSNAESMPTECKMSFVTTMEDCSDDSDSDNVYSDQTVLELSSELMRGLDAAEHMNSKIQERLVHSVSQPLCTQVVVWKPPEDFLQKVLVEAHKHKGPTITEICDGMDLSKMEVVRSGVVVVDPDDLWDCPNDSAAFEEMDMS